jgi:hypothetical protein
MSTLETQYKNYKELNPLSELSFDEWKKMHGLQIMNAFKSAQTDKIRPELIKKMNTQEEFNLNADEIWYIIENWLSLHTGHKMDYVNLKCDSNDTTAEVRVNKNSIFRI